MKEIDELGPDWVPAYEDLEEKLPYTDAVLHETLRLFPPAFNLWRQTEEPIEFEGEFSCKPARRTLLKLSESHACWQASCQIGFRRLLKHSRSLQCN